jgi:hypothetical protein
LFHKVGNPGGGSIPKTNWLCENDVLKVYEKQQAQPKGNVFRKKVSIIADEMTNFAG